jgi:hypothetical protein
MLGCRVSSILPVFFKLLFQCTTEMSGICSEQQSRNFRNAGLHTDEERDPDGYREELWSAANVSGTDYLEAFCYVAALWKD